MELKIEIIKLAHEIRDKTLERGYSTRLIEIVIPTSLEPFLHDLYITDPGDFKFVLKFDSGVEAIHIFPVFPITPEDQVERLGWLRQFWKFVARWLDFSM